MSQDEPSLKQGDTLDGRYRIVSEGILGGLWRTYVAYDIPHDQLVDVLLFARRLGTDVGMLERLARRNQAVADLEQPALVAFERAGLADGRVYLVRRHLDGPTLKQWLDQSGFLDVDMAVTIAAEVCEALAPLHRAGLVHGGLSPQSIWIGTIPGQPHVSIVDTGLLPALSPFLAPPDRGRDRFPYLAPEQTAGQEGHPSTDVFAAGLLLYEMLAGGSPFSGPAGSVAAGAAVPLQARVPHVPPVLAQIAHTALAEEPTARYRNAGQMARLLRSPDSLRWAPPAAAATGRTASAAAPAAGAAQIVVPSAAPPSRPFQGRHGSQVYYPEFEAEQWADDRGPVDWLLVALAVAALLALLGLIPLWRVVYRRYAEPQVPPAARVVPGRSTRASFLPVLHDGAECAQDGEMCEGLLAKWAVLKYNGFSEAKRECQLEKRTNIYACPAGRRSTLFGSISQRQSPDGEIVISSRG